ncbi:MAG: hypothetical protein JWO05_1072 [Gemmatimonadetes bacterium]|nr:hypothetical protein [Gemmatimonadota bacterium]
MKPALPLALVLTALASVQQRGRVEYDFTPTMHTIYSGDTTFMIAHSDKSTKRDTAIMVLEKGKLYRVKPGPRLELPASTMERFAKLRIMMEEDRSLRARMRQPPR